MVSDILNKHLPPDTRVWVFGSRAKWETTDASDLDLAVEGPRPVDHGTMTELDVAFDDSDLPYTVDVVDLKTVSDSFKKIINTQKVPLLFVNQNDNLRTQSSETTLIPKGWINAIFSDVVDINPKRNLRKGATVKFVSMENLKPFVRTASNYTIKNYSGGSKFQNGDTLFARITPSLENGKTAYVDFLDEDEVGAGSTEFIILTPKDKRLDPLFVYYLSRTAMVRDIAIKSMTGTSGRQRVEENIFKKINVTIPSILEQKAITKILSDLDSKIELNYQMNKILEEMVRALFRSWFVDFDPVRAKISGRWKRGKSLLGLPLHLYDLFPDALVDSELGKIPKGWKVTDLNNYSTLNPESWSRTNAPTKIEYVDLSNTKSGTIQSTHRYAWSNAPSRAKRILRSGDTIIGIVRPGNKLYALVRRDGLTGSTGFAVLRPHHMKYREFVYLASTDLQNIKRLAHNADGAAYPAIKPEIIMNTPTITPNSCIDLLDQFHYIVSPIINMISQINLQTHVLFNLRNKLLPKLMSGKIRIQTGARR
ncbi:MAG: restriction endonuclease subunit S [Thaumarchaeota archaeon]|nr:restriction endonuclease subunit S [Nitrososphaerota archaeon]